MSGAPSCKEGHSQGGAHDNRPSRTPSPSSPGRPRQRRPGAVAEAVPHAVVAVLPCVDLHPTAVAAPAAQQTLVGAGGRGLSSANGEIHSGSIAAMAPGRYACQGRRASEQAAAQTVLACPLPSQGDERLVAAAAVELPPLQAARVVAGDETAGRGGHRLIDLWFLDRSRLGGGTHRPKASRQLHASCMSGALH